MDSRAEKKARMAEITQRVFGNVAKTVKTRPVHVVQVGANDGKLADPVYPFFEGAGWQGLLLEPNPTYFARLKELHAGRTGVTPLQVGCSDVEAEMVLYALSAEFEHLYRRNARGCASLEKDRMVAALAKENADGIVPDGHIAEITVPLRPLDAVLAEHGVKTTDVLVIDVEGHEVEVLAGCDLSRLKPKLAFVEINTRGKRWPVINAFRDQGYRTFKLAGDMIALSPKYPAMKTMAKDLIAFGAREFGAD